MADQGHGGSAVAHALQALGISELFTLTGGHIFPILDGCHQAGMRIVDTRHEQTAVFAAEGSARLTRAPAVCAVTAGPGVTNALSGLAQAASNGAPVLCLAGRAPSFRWGQGSLQEVDHVPFVDPIAPAATIRATDDIAREVLAAGAAALAPPRGPRFLDFPIDVLFNAVEVGDLEPPVVNRPAVAGLDALEAAIAGASRPVVVAGSNVYLDGAEDELTAAAEGGELPVFMSGQGRGVLPFGHRLAFSRARSLAWREADLVIVAGTPLDFRLGFGQGFGPAARVVHVDVHPDLLASHVELAAGVSGPLADIFTAVADAARPGASARREWTEGLRAAERAKADATEAELRSSASPIHPLRIYGDLVPLLAPDAVVICDGGDFASYAGREVPVHEPGRWLDPGPFGCLGVGAGYAIAARLARPDSQVVVLYGDGALGFSGMDLETLVRLDLPVVCVVGNNGIWGLEKHPMQALYGYDVAAELRPGIRYDLVMEAFGGRGFYVEDADDIAPALKQAFDCGRPALVNVVTDPSVAYPRSSNLM